MDDKPKYPRDSEIDDAKNKWWYEIEAILNAPKKEPETVPSELDFIQALKDGRTEQATAIALMSISAALFDANDIRREQLELTKQSTASVQKVLGDSLTSVLRGSSRGPQTTP